MRTHSIYAVPSSAAGAVLSAVGRLVDRGSGRHSHGDPFCRHNRGVIGHLEKTVFDCPDPRVLATFYAAILGMRINEDSDDWVVIGSEPGARQLAFQRVAHYRAPDWPDPQRPQHLHLDIRVEDVAAAERQVLALGATRLPGDLEGRYRVFADPAGHPFCLVFGRHNARTETTSQ